VNIKIYNPKKEKVILIIGKIILWTIIIIIASKGVSSILKGNANLIIRDNIRKSVQKDFKKESVEKEAVAFAKNFLVEYMTYGGDEKDYSKRLSKFSSLKFENELQVSDVIYVNNTMSKWINDKLILVDCKIKVTSLEDNHLAVFVPNNGGTPTPQPTSTINLTENMQTKTSIIYMRVPVSCGTSFSVNSYPLVVEGTSNVNTEKESKIPGTLLDKDSEASEVEKTIKSFLDSYYKGSDDIDFFLAKSAHNDINKLDGSFKIKSFEQITINKYKDKYYTRVNYTITGKNITLKQNFDFICISNDGKYLIEKFNLKLF
jgi:hypothetical protein